MPQERDDLNENLVEIERARIGNEIHDALLPLIFAASSGVSNAINHLSDDTGAKQKLIQVSQWLTDATQTGRRLLTEIYPPELTGTLWIRATKDTISRLFDDSEVSVGWKTEGDVEQTSMDVALTLYRIVIESVRNAVRHGKAGQISVEATRTGDAIEVIVRDEGCGFDPAMIPEDRFGIRAMTGRAKLAGGSLVIDSKPGGPTTVTLNVQAT